MGAGSNQGKLWKIALSANLDVDHTEEASWAEVLSLPPFHGLN